MKLTPQLEDKAISHALLGIKHQIKEIEQIIYSPYKTGGKNFLKTRLSELKEDLKIFEELNKKSL